MEVRVASYNIQYGFGQDGKYDLNRIVDTVKDADIVDHQRKSLATLSIQERTYPAAL